VRGENVSNGRSDIKIDPWVKERRNDNKARVIEKPRKKGLSQTEEGGKKEPVKRRLKRNAETAAPKCT